MSEYIPVYTCHMKVPGTWSVGFYESGGKWVERCEEYSEDLADQKVRQLNEMIGRN